MLFLLSSVLALVLVVSALAIRADNGTTTSNATCTAENIETRIEWANMASTD